MSDFIARFTLAEEQEPIKATFSMNLIPEKLSQLENDMNFVTKDEVNFPDVDLTNVVTKDELEAGLETRQPLGDYALKSEIPDTSNLATKDDIPTYTAGENITIENGVISSAGGSVDLTGYIKNQEVLSGAISIGSANTARSTIAIGTDLHVSGKFGVAIARSSYLNGDYNIAIGSGVTTSGGQAICIGGGNAKATDSYAMALGFGTQASGNSSIAIGYAAKATQNNAIQLGLGTNNTYNSFQVGDYPLLNLSDGKMPIERLPFQTITQADYDSLTTKDANTLYLIEE